MIQAKPFLKWAGGKRQLLDVLNNSLPPSVRKNRKIDLYVEPFIGGGAFLFHLLSNYHISKAIINDINPDLMITYYVVKTFPNELITQLDEIQNIYLNFNEEKRKKYYYTVLRKNFNELKTDFNTEEKKKWITKASLFISLNRLCFNGLFRQNSRGEFNVPAGKYKNPKILDSENILAASKILSHTQICCGNFNDIEIPIIKNNFVYFDPPYRPLSDTSSFTKYSKEDFNDENQVSLSNFFKKLDRKGFNLLLSNSDTKDGFFQEIYKGFRIKRIKTKRSINCKGNGRGSVNELLISNH